MQNDRSSLARGYLIALISSAILSTTAIFIRYLTQNYSIPPLVLAFLRDVFAALTLLFVLLIFRRVLLHIKSQHMQYLAVYGFVLAIFNALWTLSVVLNGAAVATMLAYSSTAFTALLGWWFLNERLDWAKSIAVVICLTGCALVSGAVNPAIWNTNIAGILTGVLAGLAYAIYSIMGRSASNRGLNPWTTLLYLFIFASVFLLFFNLIPGGWLPGSADHLSDLIWPEGTLSGWAILILLAAGPTVLGFGLYMVSLVYLPSSVANLVLTSEPVFTALFAFFLLGERLNKVQILGSVMILTGVLFLRIYEGLSANQKQPSISSDIGPSLWIE